MMLIGSEFKRKRVKNIVNFPSNQQPTTNPMFTGDGVFHITGSVRLVGPQPNGRSNTIRFRTEGSSYFYALAIGPTTWNVDFTWHLGGGNDRSIFFQGASVVGRTFVPISCVFNGYIDQVG